MPMQDRITAATDGELFEGRARTLSPARMLAFSGGLFDAAGWPDANLHTDIDKAREAGLEAIIASGTQSEGILLELLVSLFGPNWHRSGVLEAKIIKSVEVGETIQAKARLISRESAGKGERIVLDAWCENGRGEKVIVGTASALAP